jgi:cytochrome c5
MFAAVLAAGCTTHEMAATSDMDLGVVAPAGDMTLVINGCPPLTTPLATPDGGAGGDTWSSYASGFFTMYCTRCHSSALSGAARNGAPDGYNWDDEAAVRARLVMIRDAVGVSNVMPPSAPTPPCDQRRRIVRWIDADAP